MTKKIIIANWKMNNSFDEMETWLESINKKIILYKKTKTLPEMVLCPPSLLLDYADELLMENELEILEKTHKNLDKMDEDELEELVSETRNINLGGQDCHSELSGSYTGNISAKMLKDCGCKYVILGHSERRNNDHDDDKTVAKKIKTAISQKLIPILCVGESDEERQKNNHLDFIKNQTLNSLPKNTNIKNIIIAYEPLWSIGTGALPSVKQIEEMAEFIKTTISKNSDLQIKSFKIIYGGSTSKSNCEEILKAKNIDGLLVGGASLVAEDFFEIVNLPPQSGALLMSRKNK